MDSAHTCASPVFWKSYYRSFYLLEVSGPWLQLVCIITQIVFTFLLLFSYRSKSDLWCRQMQTKEVFSETISDPEISGLQNTPCGSQIPTASFLSARQLCIVQAFVDAAVRIPQGFISAAAADCADFYQRGSCGCRRFYQS